MMDNITEYLLKPTCELDPSFDISMQPFVSLTMIDIDKEYTTEVNGKKVTYYPQKVEKGSQNSTRVMSKVGRKRKLPSGIEKTPVNEPISKKRRGRPPRENKESNSVVEKHNVQAVIKEGKQKAVRSSRLRETKKIFASNKEISTPNSSSLPTQKVERIIPDLREKSLTKREEGCILGTRMMKMQLRSPEERRKPDRYGDWIVDKDSSSNIQIAKSFIVSEEAEEKEEVLQDEEKTKYEKVVAIMCNTQINLNKALDELDIYEEKLNEALQTVKEKEEINLSLVETIATKDKTNEEHAKTIKELKNTMKEMEEQLRKKELKLQAKEKRLRQAQTSLSKYKLIAIENEMEEDFSAKEIAPSDSSERSIAVCALDPKPQGDFKVKNDNEEITLAVIHPHTSNDPMLIDVSSENGTIEKPVAREAVKELEITSRFQICDDHCYYAHKQEHTGSANSHTEGRTLLVHSSSNRKIIQKDAKSSNSEKPVVSLQSLKLTREINDHNRGITDCIREIDEIKKLKFTKHVQKTDDHYSYTCERKNTGSVDSQTASKTLLLHPSCDNRIIQKDGTSSSDEKKTLSQQLIKCVQEVEDHSQEMIDDAREMVDHMQKKVKDHCQKMAGDTREIEDHSQETTDDTREIIECNDKEMEGHTQEIEDHGQEMLGGTQKIEDHCQKMADDTREMEVDVRKIEDRTQEMEDHSQDMVDDTREVEDDVKKIEVQCQKMAGDTREMEGEAREMEDLSQKMLGDTQKQEYDVRKIDHTQEIKDHSQEIVDGTRETEDHSQEMVDDTQEMENHTQQIKERCQQMANDIQEMETYPRKIIQEMENGTRQMENHPQKMVDHVQQMADHSHCTLVYNGVERTHSECENKSMLSRSKNGAVQRKKISSEVQKHGQLLQSANHSLNTENVSNSTFSHDCAQTYSTNSQVTRNPVLNKYFVSVAKVYEELQKKKSPSAYDKAVEYSYKLFKFMNTLKYPDLDYICNEIITYFRIQIFWRESPTESFPASSDFENVLQLDEQAFIHGVKLTLQEGLKIQSIVSRLLDYVVHFMTLSDCGIMHLKSLARVYAALCKQINDKDKFMVLIFTILKRDKIALYLVAIIASVWPEVLQETINGEKRDHILVKVISYALFTKPAELDDDLWNYSVYVFKTLCKLSTSGYELQFLLYELFSGLLNNEESLSPFKADKNFLLAISILIGKHGWEWSLQHIILPCLVAPFEIFIEAPKILALFFTILVELGVEFNKTDEIMYFIEKFNESPIAKASSDIVKLLGFVARMEIRKRLSEKPAIPQMSVKTALQ